MSTHGPSASIRRRLRAAAALASAAASLLAGCSSSKPPPADAPAPVRVAAAQRKQVADRITAVGTVEAINSVAVKSLVDGQLLQSAVHDGDEIRAGQLLFKIDPRPAQAALAQAQAALSRDVAARDLARAQVERYKPVAAKGFISADQMQQYLTAYESALASVKVDQANVEAAKLTAGYTDIYAPIAGRAGRILVQPGNLVKANDVNPLLVINQIAPIYVSFAIPGQLVARVRSAQAQGALGVAATADGMAVPESGRLAFVDNAVDPATSTVKLRARFDNAGQRLWPGQFVNVALDVGSDDAVVVPAMSVKTGPNGSYVFVVTADGRAAQRDVDVARTVDDESVIAKGVAAGDRVVTDGQSRLVDGTKVKLVDEAGGNAPARAGAPTAAGAESR